jgi:hypothetical protein
LLNKIDQLLIDKKCFTYHFEFGNEASCEYLEHVGIFDNLPHTYESKH